MRISENLPIKAEIKLDKIVKGNYLMTPDLTKGTQYIEECLLNLGISEQEVCSVLAKTPSLYLPRAAVEMLYPGGWDMPQGLPVAVEGN